jgi:phage gpG-like protein
MTVIGCAGTGKSVSINTVVGSIQKMFQDNDSVVVAAPTGAAAHNVGGQTMHREFKIGIEKKEMEYFRESKRKPKQENGPNSCSVY